MGGSILLLVGLFLALMDEKYRKTFLSVETGGQFTRRNFLEGDDVMKSSAFSKHEVHWAPIRDKVEAWIRAGWNKWEEDRPDWCTDQWKLKVPKDMIPKKNEGENVGSVAVRRQEGRRKSLVKRRKGVNSKVMPAGQEVEEQVDVKDFMRELKTMKM
ncbi:hypothetical protein TL16_g09801 [Triparma laevis f. inornata]|uniref:Uncharacterized protein n=1 Tax=Triparma laevis f. inornata TaxID=1714386 RepID=A0A9W7BDB6_9STRA|nr:hypothetical protein TL16_g09801 [Triparma laevis f. inornata]